MSRIEVASYAGYRADERPLHFIIGDCRHEVESVEDQWYGPSARYFRVRARDGNLYILRHDEHEDIWTLVGFRSCAAGYPGPFPSSSAGIV